MIKKVKFCSKCGSELPATKEYFYTDIRRIDGLANPCKLCKRKYEETKRGKQLDANRHLKYRYGTTIEIYDSLYVKQSGRCGVCGRHQSMFDKKLHIDHDHKTGRIRGLTCNGCNRLIGRYELSQLKNLELIKKIRNFLNETTQIQKTETPDRLLVETAGIQA